MATTTVNSRALSSGTHEREASMEYIRHLEVRSANRLFSQPIDEVDFLTAEANYVDLHVGAQVFRVRCTMKNLELRLDPKKFFRIHRCTIVNVDRITDCRTLRRGDYIVTLQGGTPLKMTRRYRACAITQYRSISN